MTRLPRRALPAASLLCALLLAIGCQHQAATSSAVSDTLKTITAASRIDSLRWPNFSDYSGQVRAFYDRRNWSLAWMDGHQPSSAARGLIELFAASAAKGLNPEDYDASRWKDRLSHLSTDAEQARFDLALTVTAMRYISALHVGRINPSHFAFGVSVDNKKYDLPQFIADKVVGSADVGAALAAIEPATAQYRDTMQALKKYQAMAADEARQKAQPLSPPAKPISAGSAYAAAAGLHARLQLLGDLSGSAPASQTTYDASLADAVKHFQLRHGLPNDGKLTEQTVAELNVPLSTRVQQLEDSLERWRWLSDEYLNAPILVNLPEFALRTYNNDHSVNFMMKVVVGESLKEDHKTPVLTQTMKYVVMRPYWTVTPNIIKKEIMPHIAANKHYLQDKGFEVVDRSGNVETGWTMEGLEHGGLMVREKPGPKNSLGLIKFMFPNKYDIYLHSTPATELFDKTRRDFSHGCIRLQDPEKMAAWVLRNDPDWTPEKIHDAMENGEDNHIVNLKKPIPVVIFYATALVIEQGPEQGQVHFFDDLYGYDQDMENVLAQGMPYPVKPEPKAQSGDTE